MSGAFVLMSAMMSENRLAPVTPITSKRASTNRPRSAREYLSIHASSVESKNREDAVKPSAATNVAARTSTSHKKGLCWNRENPSLSTMTGAKSGDSESTAPIMVDLGTVFSMIGMTRR